MEHRNGFMREIQNLANPFGYCPPETVGRFDSDPHLHSFHVVCLQRLLGSETNLRAGTRLTRQVSLADS
jgi:hypothetical protein